MKVFNVNKLMENVHVYIDGGYLSKIAKHLFGFYPEYDIKQFANTLAKEQGLWCLKAYYYTAPPL